jgi:eukaryotic-like serine/threonine-protein kinase
MRADLFKEVQRIFDAALEQDEGSRIRFVEVACGLDRALAEEVLTLLAYEAKAHASETVRPFALAADAFESAETNALIGQIVGRYRLEAEIASGGMGRVFKAWRVDGDVEQIVALKLIRVEMFNPALLKRFSTERKILASLNHPGIAHLIDAGTDERGTPFVAMEYVDGLPLQEYCTRNALPIRARIELFRQVLAAVSHAHRNLVVHRDLKPSNILVSADGRVKLLDFGIAKELDVDLGRQDTATAHRFFTPAFAAPEQLDDGNVSIACDIYGLGAVLYVLLTGAPPFDFSELSPGEIERRIRMVPPASMSASVAARGDGAIRALGVENTSRWSREIKGDLEQIVQKALRKEPQSRYLSVDQFDEDIARYLDRRPVLASGAGWWYRTRKYCERNALAVSFSLVFAAAGAVAVAHVLRQNAEIRAERDRTQIALDRAQIAFDILQNTFRSADPTGLDGGDMRARSMLAAASREVDRLEISQPDLYRDLSYRIADIQLNMGMTGAGLDLVQRANRTIRAPADEGRLLEIRAKIMATRYAEARALIEAARARLRDHPEFIAEDAHLLYLERRYPQAIALLDPLLARRSMAPTLRDRIYWYLAEAYRESNRFEQAVAVLDRQIREQSVRNGQEHPSTLVSRLRRIEPLIALEQAASAERELIALKPKLDRHYDAESSIMGLYYNLLGKALNAQEKPVEALAHYRQALTINQKSLGADHQNTWLSHMNIALVIMYGGGDRRDAYPHFASAIAGFEKDMKTTASLAGFARLEAATAHYWDKNDTVARRMLTPPHALEYFERMTESNRAQYLAGLFYGFGRQDCSQGWQKRVQALPESKRVARTLLCRYDPQAKNRPVD